AISPTRKNTAWMWWAARVSSTSGVVLGFGPSSNVNRISGPPEADAPAAGVGQALAQAPLPAPRASIAVTNPLRFTLVDLTRRARRSRFRTSSVHRRASEGIVGDLRASEG